MIQNKLLYRIALILNKKLKFIALRNIINKAIELTIKTYSENVIPIIDEFSVTEKLDGERCILYYNSDEKYIIFNKKIIKFEYDLQINSVILDCEYYNKKLYAFDIFELNGKNLTELSFKDRYKIMTNNLTSNNIIIKIFTKLDKSNYCLVMTNIYNNTKHKIDGLILTSLNENYNNTMNFKWKPIENMTIDFLVKLCPKYLIGLHPYVKKKKNNSLYLLFSGINKNDMKRMMMQHIKYYKDLFIEINNLYFPILFSPLDNIYAHIFESDKSDLDGKICEFNYNNKWNLLKVRNDQIPNIKNGVDIGNNYFTCLDIWNNYKNPLTFKKMCLNIDELNNMKYFVKDEMKFIETRKYNRFVTSTVLQKISKISSVLDIGIGRGADVFKFNNMGTKYLVGLDIDLSALEELIFRYKTMIKKNKIKPMKLRIKQLNLNEPYEQNINEMIESGIIDNNTKFKLIFSNFAFHYFLGNLDSIENILNYINNFSEKGTSVIFTCFDGNKLFTKFKELKDNDTYMITEQNITKVTIKRKFEIGRLLEYGQIIEVTHPFSGGVGYDEPMVNIKFITKMFKKFRFKHCYTKNFLDFLDSYQKKNNMTKSDKEYCSLYIINEFKKS
jgi:hypothetical protein